MQADDMQITYIQGSFRNNQQLPVNAAAMRCDHQMRGTLMIDWDTSLFSWAETFADEELHRWSHKCAKGCSIYIQTGRKAGGAVNLVMDKSQTLHIQKTIAVKGSKERRVAFAARGELSPALAEQPIWGLGRNYTTELMDNNVRMAVLQYNNLQMVWLESAKASCMASTRWWWWLSHQTERVCTVAPEALWDCVIHCQQNGCWDKQVHPKVVDGGWSCHIAKTGLETEILAVEMREPTDHSLRSVRCALVISRRCKSRGIGSWEGCSVWK